MGRGPSGLLLVDKPTGPSSASLARALGRTLGAAKVGHGGTLDPMASGLLVVCLGEATKVAGYLLDADKGYEAELTFGVETDTHDAQGRETSWRDASALGEMALRAALGQLTGAIAQVPPMHAAIKVEGRRLYELARKGQEVARAPRPVVVHALELVAFWPAAADEPPRARVRIACSKGTYVRALARDLGAALGVGAHLSMLRRTRTAGLDVADARTPEAIESAHRAGTLVLLAPARAVAHLPQLVLGAEEERRVRMGQGIALPPELAGRAEGTALTLLDERGALVALAEVRAGRAKVLRGLNADQ